MIITNLFISIKGAFKKLKVDIHTYYYLLILSENSIYSIYSIYPIIILLIIILILT